MTPFSSARDGALLDALESGLDSRADLLRFAELVARWGKRTDLVAAGTPRDLVEILMVDALALRGALLPNASVLDVGAGAGAPAIPLALMRPDLSFTLLEPRRRRVAFLRTAVGELGLASRVKVLEGRVDEDGQLDASPNTAPTVFDVAFSRATFAPEHWLALGAKLAPRVVLALAREPNPDTEGWILEEHAYEVPSSGAPRRLVVCRR